jgi:hypothetical protein
MRSPRQNRASTFRSCQRHLPAWGVHVLRHGRTAVLDRAGRSRQGEIRQGVGHFRRRLRRARQSARHRTRATVVACRVQHYGTASCLALVVVMYLTATWREAHQHLICAQLVPRPYQYHLNHIPSPTGSVPNATAHLAAKRWSSADGGNAYSRSELARAVLPAHALASLVVSVSCSKHQTSTSSSAAIREYEVSLLSPMARTSLHQRTARPGLQ